MNLKELLFKKVYENKVIIIFVLNLLSLITESSCTFNFKLGYTLPNSVEITSLVKLSPEDCIKECQAREACLSIQTDNRVRLCRLSSSDTSSIPISLKRSPGTWYSEKSSWTQRSIDPRCNDKCSPTDTCRLSGGDATCEISECPKQPRLDATSEIQGSMLAVGSNSVHTCPLNRTRAVSTCGPDGQWSLQQFTCPIVCEAGWVKYQESCYYFEDDYKTFDEAKSMCRAMNAIIVHVETTEENEMIKAYLSQLPTLDDYWLGLIDGEQEGQWKWYDTDTEATFLDWNPGEASIQCQRKLCCIW